MALFILIAAVGIVEDGSILQGCALGSRGSVMVVVRMFQVEG